MNEVVTVAPPGAAFHPADELAYVRGELDRLTGREIALTRTLVADRESRVGSLHHAVVQRVSGRDAVDIERLPDLREVLRLLSRPVLCIDCETTGLHPLDGDRMVSLAILQAQVCSTTTYGSDRSPQWQHGEGVALESRTAYVAAFNPEGRKSSPEALAVHGLSDERLAACAPFSDRARDVDGILTGQDDEFGATTVVAHNAPFDVGFLDMEFERAGRAVSWGPIVDTRLLSKMLWPEAKGSLDALCERLGVDRGDRDERHESLKDARLLALCIPGLVAELRRRVA
ncbi:Exonuclease [Methylobacterium sp. UNC300MFChir4.1]|uniref:3'-5' exonuclease n=1 Tax=Methylobacterium sp. UNC300MFChir4.1 TaxID=1502747 RepID=UPI0008D708EF|nr:exonuclease domain-containing protein [Methylobacterium sp. UNC300MFChir4.1]SEP04974.1 Exonuclease [Methylobacterium sp. UNC300MFChir4.1]